MPLKGFAAPGNLKELSKPHLRAWSDRLSELFDVEAGRDGHHFYNPTKSDTPVGSSVVSVTWPAAPGRLLSTRLTPQVRWETADRDRNQQDEYCEWSVLREGDKVVSVTFTTETPDYYDHLMDVDQGLLTRLYETATVEKVPVEALRDRHGIFKAGNSFNSRTDGPIVHLMQGNNNLRAAVNLAAAATVLREGNDGRRITHPQTLIACGELGDERRHSDPRIASAVNNLVAKRFEITLRDPPGLYLDRFVTRGMETPDGTDPRTFWRLERGQRSHALRVRFEVPAKLGYAVGDITIGGQRIVAGAQLAERLSVRIEAVARPGTFDLLRKGCTKASNL